MKKLIACLFCVFALFTLFGKDFSPAEVPSGWASYTGTTNLAGEPLTPPSFLGGNNGSKSVTVTTKKELLAALKSKDPKVIYIDGIIDMTEGMLPAKATETTKKLDAFVAEVTSQFDNFTCETYEAWRNLYANNVLSYEDPTGDIKKVQTALKNAWGKIIIVSITSNKTLIGLGKNSGMKGAALRIKNAENIILRNLHIQDAFDPFPVLEGGDGLNAQYDGLAIQGSKYIWVDHCTFEDTLAFSDNDLPKVKTKDGEKLKWQSYDGLLDITNKNDFVTVSWCVFRNHDKTMLIGSSDKQVADINHQTITLHHNYFDGATQRLPMVRFATIHIYNNVFDNQNSSRANAYAIGIRKDAKIVAENNYFGTGIKYSLANNDGKIYFSGNEDNSKYKFNKSVPVATKPWNPEQYYDYSLDETSSLVDLVKEQAGAGK